MRDKRAYLQHGGRLQDVICAVQVLGTYRTTSATAEKWAQRIGAAPVSANSWSEIFREHPEFFRVSEKEDEEGGTADAEFALVLRRSQERLWLKDERRLATPPEVAAMKAAKTNKTLMTWQPLAAAQISALVEVAIKMHAAEWAHREKSRWWVTLIPSVLALLGSVGGALIGAYLGAKK